MYLAQESLCYSLNRDRDGPHGPLLPYHRTYGSHMCVTGHKEMYHKWS